MESETRARLRAETEEHSIVRGEVVLALLDDLDAAERETARQRPVLTGIVLAEAVFPYHVGIELAAGTTRYALVPLVLIEQARTVLQATGEEGEHE